MGGVYTEIFAIAIDENDYLFVADYTGSTIQILDPDGVLIAEFDSVAGAGSFDLLSGLAFGSDGALYVVEEGNNRILKLTLPAFEE